jgi:hypothetical protein
MRVGGGVLISLPSLPTASTPGATCSASTSFNSVSSSVPDSTRSPHFSTHRRHLRPLHTSFAVDKHCTVFAPGSTRCVWPALTRRNRMSRSQSQSTRCTLSMHSPWGRHRQRQALHSFFVRQWEVRACRHYASNCLGLAWTVQLLTRQDKHNDDQGLHCPTTVRNAGIFSAR